MEINIRMNIEDGKIVNFRLFEAGTSVMEYNCPLRVNEAVRKVKNELDRLAGCKVRYSKYILRDDDGHITAYKSTSAENAIKRARRTFGGEWRLEATIK